jgi:hypothetical protein
MITGHSLAQIINQEKMDDAAVEKLVKKPDHYTGGEVECLQAIKAATKGLPAYEAICVGHIMRYIWRYRVKHAKNPLVDVGKARFFFDELETAIRDSEREQS